MNILFLHRNFPAQFRHLLFYFKSRPEHRVAFITHNKNANLPGIISGIYSLSRKASPHTHYYLREYEETILHGQGAARVALKLKKQGGFQPDIIFGHSWGPISFMKDIFPDAPLLGYFEWFYRSRGTDIDFGASRPPSLDTLAKTRIKNSHLLVDLHSSDAGIVPTCWQLKQFPPEFRPKLTVLHDGVDTDFFSPDPNKKGVNISTLKLKIPDGKEIVTYATRGMEPYRGFPPFMKACEILLRNRPACHVVIAGSDRVCYGAKRSDGKTYKELMLETCELDSGRVHFTGLLPYPQYRSLLQASWAHVYLTYPFVLSWSMLEAMSVGCALVASDTPPVTEVVRNMENGLLADFFSPEDIAAKVEFCLDNQQEMLRMRKAARNTILERYRLQDCLSAQIKFFNKWTRSKG